MMRSARVESPESMLVDSVCAAAALTLENERLRAELLARLVSRQQPLRPTAHTVRAPRGNTSWAPPYVPCYGLGLSLTNRRHLLWFLKPNCAQPPCRHCSLVDG